MNNYLLSAFVCLLSVSAFAQDKHSGVLNCEVRTENGGDAVEKRQIIAEKINGSLYNYVYLNDAAGYQIGITSNSRYNNEPLVTIIAHGNGAHVRARGANRNIVELELQEPYLHVLCREAVLE